MNQPLFWILFTISVVLLLSLDLGLHRKFESIPVRIAILWSLIWIALAGIFAVLLYAWQGGAVSLDFVTAYFIELSLSVDNLFIFLLIFRYFRVPERDQHKVLFWGILSAIAMRGVFIFAGVGLLRRFDWLVYLFGAFLVYSGIRFLTDSKSRAHPEKSWVVRGFRRLIPVTEGFEDGKFLVRRDGLHATPLLIVLLLIETTDLLFATDSIPAVLAITLNFLVVFTSNVLAILGLRSMYFAVAGMVDKFQYLHYGLSAVLILVGAKMLAAHYYPVSTSVALAVIAGILFVSMMVSITSPRKARA